MIFSISRVEQQRRGCKKTAIKKHFDVARRQHRSVLVFLEFDFTKIESLIKPIFTISHLSTF